MNPLKTLRYPHQLSTGLESSPDGIVICDAEGTVVDVNDELASIFGTSKEDLLNTSIDELLPVDHRDEHTRHRSAYLADPAIRSMAVSKEVLGVRRDGSKVWLEIRLRPIVDSGRQFVAASVRDVSEQRLMDQVRERSNYTLRLLASGVSSDQVIQTMLCDTQQALRPAQCYLICNGDAQDTVSVYTVSATSNLIAEQLESIAKKLSREHEFFRHDGVCYDNGLNALPSLLKRFMSEHELLSIWTSVIRDSSGARLGLFVALCEQAFSPSTRNKAALSAATDLAAIVLEKGARDRRLQEKENQLRQTQKLEAIGTLVGGISHEFNNLLQIIDAYTNLALEGLDQNDQRFRDLKRVATASTQASSLTSQLLNFSRHVAPDLKSTDFKRIVKKTSELLKRIAAPGVRLDVSLCKDECRVRADETQLQQVMVNLFLNAQDAMSRGGRVCLGTEVLMVSMPEAERLGLEKSGRVVRLTFSDSGGGIPPGVLNRMFDPFFTTKEVGQGTGLGLSVVYSIVRDHGGVINVESQIDQGSCFYVYLPTIEPHRSFSAGGFEEHGFEKFEPRRVNFL